jgi:8-oxo-dGTP diphosphatase
MPDSKHANTETKGITNSGITGVGIGVLIMKDSKVLFGKRKGSHGAGTWSLPGGKLHFGESFEQCAVREVKEETGLDIVPGKIVSVSNDIAYGMHWVTIGMSAEIKSGKVELIEPDKCAEWAWFSLDRLPTPLFVPTERVVRNYLNKTIHKNSTA